MDPRTLIVSRIDLHLRRQLGANVDSYRALTDSRYMRDVLLVCDAMTGTDLPLLARQFRVAGTRMAQEAQPSPGHDSGPAQDWAADTSGFGVSQPASLPRLAAQRSTGVKPWFAPSRWLAR